MAWNYRKRIKIIPGVHLNLSKGGISTSIGVRGANLTLGKNGTYLNTGIPGTGIYQRKKISGSSYSQKPPSLKFSADQSTIVENEIFSADVQEITSQDMQGIKDAILLAREQQRELIRDLEKTKSDLTSKKWQLVFSYILIFGLIYKDLPIRLKKVISSQKSVIKEINKQIDNCHVNLKVDFDDAFLEKYNQLQDSFTNLCSSQKIWDVTSEQIQNKRITRSSAGKLVKKKEIKFKKAQLPFIKCEYDALCFKNANGADFYFYPYFVVMYSTAQKFAVIGIDELEFHYSYVKFTETGSIPTDSKVIEYTWAKVNKNGSRDKRFKGNFQIPVVRYGEFSLTTPTGVNEEYEISNYEFSQAFGKAFKEYQEIVRYCNPSISINQDTR